MPQLSRHLHIAIQSVKLFKDDGVLDEGEVNFLLGLALSDDIIDEEEKRVLGGIFRRALDSHQIGERTVARIMSIRKKHGIDVSTPEFL